MQIPWSLSSPCVIKNQVFYHLEICMPYFITKIYLQVLLVAVCMSAFPSLFKLFSEKFYLFWTVEGSLKYIFSSSLIKFFLIIEYFYDLNYLHFHYWILIFFFSLEQIKSLGSLFQPSLFFLFVILKECLCPHFESAKCTLVCHSHCCPLVH